MAGTGENHLQSHKSHKGYKWYKRWITTELLWTFVLKYDSQVAKLIYDVLSSDVNSPMFKGPATPRIQFHSIRKGWYRHPGGFDWTHWQQPLGSLCQKACTSLPSRFAHFFAQGRDVDQHFNDFKWLQGCFRARFASPGLATLTPLGWPEWTTESQTSGGPNWPWPCVPFGSLWWASCHFLLRFADPKDAPGGAWHHFLPCYAPCQCALGFSWNGGLTTEKILYLPDCCWWFANEHVGSATMPIHNDEFSTPGMLLVLYAPRDCTTRGAEAAW